MKSVTIAMFLAFLFLNILVDKSSTRILPQNNNVCDECKFPFEYDGIEFDGCTVYGGKSTNVNYDQPMTWCVTNTTAFLEDESTGWEYCSSECSKDSSDYIKLY